MGARRRPLPKAFNITTREVSFKLRIGELFSSHSLVEFVACGLERGQLQACQLERDPGGARQPPFQPWRIVGSLSSEEISHNRLSGVVITRLVKRNKYSELERLVSVFIVFGESLEV